MSKVLLFASERYALPILAPIAAALHAAGHQACAWFVDGAAGAALPPPVRMLGLQEAVDLRPQAVVSAANWVPTFISGTKVQVFHGFNVHKRSDGRGHFRVRGLFDLYCTQGPATTAPFLELARQTGHFAVVETGWPKLDPVFFVATKARCRRCAQRPAGAPWSCSEARSPNRWPPHPGCTTPSRRISAEASAIGS